MKKQAGNSTLCKVLMAVIALVGMGVGATEPAAEGQWKTAYVKRGFCGAFQLDWLKGTGSVIRTRTPMPYDGSRVKIKVMGCHATEVQLDHLFLVQGVDDAGKVTGSRYPVLFDGKPTVSLSGLSSKWSDPADVPVKKGTWYVQDSYLSPKAPYAYDVDTFTCDVKGSDDKDVFVKKSTGSRVGILTRIDVFTTDPRLGIVCYGDSITHGYGSTPSGGQRYPDQLAKLLDRPVLNFGVNGDMIKGAAGLPGEIQSLKGVDTVVFLMGINDIFTGSIKQLSDYTSKLRPLVTNLKSQKLKVYVGTLLPAGGNKQFDRAPEKEKLRQEINAWIRASSGADQVIDFDRALCDPAATNKMQVELQSDWVHPSDQGYKKMAEAAAAVMGRVN